MIVPLTLGPCRQQSGLLWAGTPCPHLAWSLFVFPLGLACPVTTQFPASTKD